VAPAAVLAAVCGASGIAGALVQHFLPGLPWLARGLFLLGLATGGYDATVDTWANLKKRDIDIHFLMLAVAIGAMFIGAWGEAVLLLFLFSASGPWRNNALDRTQREVSALLKTSPKRATVLRPDGTEQVVPVEELQLHQRVLVRPGEAFAADGLILKGRSASDESALTGEANPVEKNTGDQVFSGTLNLWGAVEFDVVRLPAESTLQKIIRLIQTAQKLKAPSERFTDKFGTGYTYAVIGGSTAMFLVWLARVPPAGVHHHAGAALGLLPGDDAHGGRQSLRPGSVDPLGHPRGHRVGARHGVLFRGGAAIEKLADINVVAMDKTGTLTTGELAVVGYESFPAGRETEVMELAYALEANSEHPLARAIVRDAKARGVRALELHDFSNIVGQGVRGKFGDTRRCSAAASCSRPARWPGWAEKLPPASPELSECGSWARTCSGASSCATRSAPSRAACWRN